jgi:hypothetical protein
MSANDKYLSNILTGHVELLVLDIATKHSDSYKLRNGKHSYTTAREILLSALEKIGLDKKLICLRSLRSGGDTSAAMAK